MTSRSDTIFLVWLESISPAYRDAMLKRDIAAIQGLTAFDISRRWAVGNTGSLVMGFLFKETLKNFKVGGSIPFLNYGVIVKALVKRKINPQRIRMVVDALEEGGFIVVRSSTTLSLSGNKTVLRLQLVDELWRFFLNRYKRNQKQDITFPHIFGRQIYCSYLAKHKDKLKLPTGICSFKTLLIILNNATKSGYIDSKEGEDMFYKMGGVVMWHEVGEGDEIKKETIRFFTKDDGKRKKINSRVLKAYNTYLLTHYQSNCLKRGIK